MKIRKATRPLSFYLFTFFIHLWLLPITYKLPAEALYVYFLDNSDHRLDDAYATVTCYTQWRNGMGTWESVQFLPQVKFHDEFAIFFFFFWHGHQRPSSILPLFQKWKIARHIQRNLVDSQRNANPPLVHRRKFNVIHICKLPLLHICDRIYKLDIIILGAWIYCVHF